MCNHEGLSNVDVDPRTSLSLTMVFEAFGLIKPENPTSILPNDTSVEAIRKKITNPKIAKAMGASQQTVEIICGIEFVANLLDSFSETGERSYLEMADGLFRENIALLSIDGRKLVLDLSKAALTYFYFEKAVAQRIKNGDQFLEEETFEYLLRRGADSTIYAAILQSDGIASPGMIAGFRARQALWDLRDDIEDLEQDKMTVGANVLLLSTQGGKQVLNDFANRLVHQARYLEIPKPLLSAVEKEYKMTALALKNL